MRVTDQAILFGQFKAHERSALLRYFVVDNNDLEFLVSTRSLNKQIVDCLQAFRIQPFLPKVLTQSINDQ